MSLGLASAPRPNVRKPVYTIEHQAAGVESDDLVVLYHERTRREQIEFVLWWALIGIGVGAFWYLAYVAFRLIVRGGL